MSQTQSSQIQLQSDQDNNEIVMTKKSFILANLLQEKQFYEENFLIKAKEELTRRIKEEIKREFFDFSIDKVLTNINGKVFTVKVLDIFSAKEFYPEVSPRVRQGYYLTIWNWFVMEMGKLAEDCDCSTSITGNNLKGNIYGEYNEVERWSVTMKSKGSYGTPESKIVIEK